MIKRLFLLLVLLLLIGGGAAYFLVPWNDVLERKITQFLNERGIQNVSFQIDKVGLHQATISDIKIGAENPLALQSVTVQYDPKELANGHIRDIALSGLAVRVVQGDAGWSIAGLDDLRQPKADGAKAMTLSDVIDILPFAKVEVRDSSLQIEGRSVQTTLPFNASLTKTPETKIDMTINASNLTSPASDVALGIIKISAQPDETRDWQGTWTLESLDFGEALPVPVLSGGGDLSYAGAVATFKGALNSADKTHAGAFTVLVDTGASEKNTLTISSLSFPFKGGMVSSKNIVVPFDRKKNITVPLAIRKVSLDALMQTLTGSRVSATGTVSGSIPVILKPDGSYTLGKGSLKADENGKMTMPSELIPGDTEQMDLVRQILENLHYSVLSASVDTSGKQGVVVRLALEGNNPDVYGGRAVKLNVNLTGDILDFIQQNAMLITKPEQLLKQETR